MLIVGCPKKFPIVCKMSNDDSPMRYEIEREENITININTQDLE